MDNETLLTNMVRIGKVSAVDADDLKVRVIYQDTNVTSGWLWVLQRPQTAVSVPTSESHSHTVNSSGEDTTANGSHTHAGSATGSWMPSVNDRVLVLYIPIFNGDGFVLGGIG